MTAQSPFGHMANRNMNNICGIHYTTGTTYWELKRHYLPQVSLKSHTVITPVCFTTHLTQTFHNPNTDSLAQVRYTFPLYDGVAVSGYTIRYAETVLRGVVKQKNEAKKTYQAAVDRGETAGLLEALPAGIFGVTIGNVPAKTDVVVEITYCGELKHDAGIDGLRWTLPTAIAPRYGEYPGEVLGSGVVDGGGISITVDIAMAGSAVRKIMSPSHPIAVSLGALSTTTSEGTTTPFEPSQASATLTLGTTELAADFVLQLLVDDISRPCALLELHPTLPNHRAIMTTLVPKFTIQSASHHPEIIFLADQSGSMGGAKNATLITALKVFLKSLPVGVRFNICAFGTRYKFLWPKSRVYDEESLRLATQFVEGFNAGYGGTKIFDPMRAVFDDRLSVEIPLEVMLLTDGEIWGEENLFSYINSQVHGSGTERADARVFALGIGGDVSHSLVEGVARAGKGFAQFVGDGEAAEGKVVRMLRAALSAHTWGYEMSVQYAGDDGKEAEGGDEVDDFEMVEMADKLTLSDHTVEADTKSVEDEKEPAKPTTKSFYDEDAKVDEQPADLSTADRYAQLPSITTPKILQAPFSVPPLFPFTRTTLYLLLSPDSTQRDITSITLRAQSAEGPRELTVPVHASTSAGDVPTIHQLAARKAVQELEEGRGWLQAAMDDKTGKKHADYPRFDEMVEREAVRLGELFQVAGKWTSYVAVGEHNESVDDADPQEESARPAQPYGARQQQAAFQPRALRMARMATPATGFGACASPPPAPRAFCRRDPPATNANTGGELFGGASFGSQRLASTGSSPFGGQNQAKNKQTGASLFGGSTTTGGGLFGNNAAPQQMSSPIRFSPGQMFGAQAQQAPVQSSGPPLQQSQMQSAPRMAMAPPATTSGACASPPPTASSPRRNAPRIAPPILPGGDDSGVRPPTQGYAWAFPAEDLAHSGTNSEESLITGGTTTTMHVLIALQTFSGAWPSGSEVYDAVDIAEYHSEKLTGYGSDKLKATALAIAYLETKAADQKDVWEMVVMKGKAWLAVQLDAYAGGDKFIEEVIAEAATFL